MEKKQKFQIYFKTFGGNIFKQDEVFTDEEEAKKWVNEMNNTLYNKHSMYFYKEVKQQELER